MQPFLKSFLVLLLAVFTIVPTSAFADSFDRSLKRLQKCEQQVNQLESDSNLGHLSRCISRSNRALEVRGAQSAASLKKKIKRQRKKLKKAKRFGITSVIKKIRKRIKKLKRLLQILIGESAVCSRGTTTLVLTIENNTDVQLVIESDAAKSSPFASGGNVLSLGTVSPVSERTFSRPLTDYESGNSITFAVIPSSGGQPLDLDGVKNAQRTLTLVLQKQEPCAIFQRFIFIDRDFGVDSLKPDPIPGENISVLCPTSYLHERFLTQQALVSTQSIGPDSDGLIKVNCFYTSPSNSPAITMTYAPNSIYFNKHGSPYSCPFQSFPTAGTFRSETRQFLAKLSVNVEPAEKLELGPELVFLYERAGATCS